MACYESHPALDVGDGRVIHGGSCFRPMDGADVYIGLDHGAPNRTGLVLHPIVDGRAPADAARFRQIMVLVSQYLDADAVVHAGCIGGHGRTGTLLAALVAYRGVSRDAIGYVRENYCRHAVETREQVEFLVREFGCLPAKPSYGL